MTVEFAVSFFTIGLIASFTLIFPNTTRFTGWEELKNLTEHAFLSWGIVMR
jgi:hypothetical protein